MKLEIKKGYIHYEITDETNLNNGKPVMFFLPGGPGFSYKNYIEALRPLEQYCHIVYHDPRGCGL